MNITGVRLREYRNYKSLVLMPFEGLNVLLGENAAGKTNVLESVFLCALGRSHRTRHDVELIRNSGDEARVALDLKKQTGSHTIACKLKRDGRRELTIDGMPLSRSGELMGCLHVVMFSPEDLKLIKQGPAERRRFLDMELSQLYPSYYYCLQRYNSALKQRNALLKTKCIDDALHTPWEEQLSRLGAELVGKRDEFIERLTMTATELHNEISDGREKLNITYRPSVAGGFEELYKAMASTREKDKLYGSTALGPHRDDLTVTLDGVDIRAYGSQGQQRTAALSMKLSEITLLKELRRESPVLLLDDVLSELDRDRQRCLVKAMRGCQTFLTCTNLAGLKEAGAEEMTVFRVRNGTVKSQ